MRTHFLGAAALAAVASFSAAAQRPDASVRGIIDSPAFKRAAAFLETDQDRFVRELIALTEIPSPPFKEQRRAAAFLEMLRESGLTGVGMDPEGNAMGLRKGRGDGLIVVNAHLDTVFPEGTDVRVKRQGTRLAAPGVGDDTRGLALILAIVRAMDAGGIRTASDILFVGNVGEEGEGDLRGIKYLLNKGPYKGRVRQMVAIDGTESSGITRGGVGSKRYRVTFRGPGGHSYGAFGLVNPAFALGDAIVRLSRLQVPSSPKTTYNVGAVRGGTSVNAIPSDVSMDVDMRSVSCGELQKVDTAFLALVREAVNAENATRSTKEGRIEADPKVIGERPCGETPMTAPIVQTAAAVVAAFGQTPTFDVSSTDANIPMSMGIPAITIGRGGPGGRQHSPDEWTDVDPKLNHRNELIALAIILGVAGAPAGVQ